MPINSPFLYYGGRFIDKIAVASELGTVRPDERITLTLDADSSIAMDFADAETLVLQMVERLYDKGALSMEAAERITYLGNSVLADTREYTEGPLLLAVDLDPSLINDGFAADTEVD